MADNLSDEMTALASAPKLNANLVVRRAEKEYQRKRRLLATAMGTSILGACVVAILFPPYSARELFVSGGDAPPLQGQALNSYPAGQGIGLLKHVEESCLILESETEAALVLFPKGTQWANEKSTVQLPSGEYVRTGVRVTLSGGYMSVDDAAMVAGDDVSGALQDCATRTDSTTVFLASP